MTKKSIAGLMTVLMVLCMTISFNVLAAEPDAEVSKGVALSVISDECTADKVVFDITYVGLSDTLIQLSLNIPVDPELIADNSGRKDVSFAFTDGFSGAKASYNSRTSNIVVTGADTNGFSDPDHKITRVTVSLAEPLRDTLKLELTKATVTDLNKEVYMLDGEGDTKLDPSFVYVSPYEGAAVPADSPEASEYSAATEPPASAEPAVTSEPAATARPASSSGGRSGGGSSSGSSSSGSSAAAAGTPKPTSSPEKEMWIEPSGDKSVLIIVRYQNGKLSSVEKKRYEGKDRIDMSGFGLKQDDRIYLFDAASGVLSQKILAEKE